MTLFQALRIGLQQVNQTRRMIFFAWLLNLLVALVLAGPFLALLDSTIRNTVMEERLLHGIDTNWFQSFRNDHQANAFARPFDFTIVGYAPLLLHYESLLSGTVVKNIGNFFIDLIFRWRIGLEYFDPLIILSFVYLLISTFLAGAFIGTYARSYPLSFQEFMMEGARYFGKFFRLALLSLLVSLVMFDFVFDFWADWIRTVTANDPSEYTPYVHYMIKNAVVLVIIGLLVMCFDYARIRMVVDDRFSALLAAWAGVKFVALNFGRVAALFLILSITGAILIALYAVLQSILPTSGYWTILLLFLLQQLYVGLRLWWKAVAYASQTRLYHDIMQIDHRTERPA